MTVLRDPIVIVIGRHVILEDLLIRRPGQGFKQSTDKAGPVLALEAVNIDRSFHGHHIAQSARKRLHEPLGPEGCSQPQQGDFVVLVKTDKIV